MTASTVTALTPAVVVLALSMQVILVPPDQPVTTAAMKLPIIAIIPMVLPALMKAMSALMMSAMGPVPAPILL